MAQYIAAVPDGRGRVKPAGLVLPQLLCLTLRQCGLKERLDAASKFHCVGRWGAAFYVSTTLEANHHYELAEDECDPITIRFVVTKVVCSLDRQQVKLVGYVLGTDMSRRRVGDRRRAIPAHILLTALNARLKF